MNVNDILNNVVAVEGGYVNDPRDAGGETIWGITVATARANGYAGEMKAMTREQAIAIYRKQYVVKPGFDQVVTISVNIAGKLVDIGVNMGVAVAGQFLQSALNALNENAKDYPDLKEDGSCGPTTRTALAAYLKKRGPQGETVMLRALNVMQGAKYLGLTQTRPEDEAFIFGWLLNRIEI